MEGFEWVGATCGIVGTALMSSKLASKKGARFGVFSLYLVSNVCMIVVGVSKGVHGLVLMQVTYLVFTLNGLRNNR